MSLQIRAVSFKLFVDNIIDATIHPAILQSLAILPVEWELVAQPVISELQVKLTFTNQVSLVINSDCITFTEVIEQQLNTLNIAVIANSYIQVFSYLGYRSLSIILQSELTFDSKARINRYIEQKLLLSNCNGLKL